MEEEIKYLIYELKGMVDMVNCRFDEGDEEALTHSQFEVIHSKVNVIASKIIEK